jgi:predicted naringenin-chalcone synthase
MDLAIIGVGTATPPDCFTQADMADAARVLACTTEEQIKASRSILDHTTIQTRYLAFPRHWVRRMIEEMPRLPRAANSDLPRNDESPLSEWYPSGRADHRGPTTGQRMQRYIEEAPPLAAEASRLALDQAGCSPEEITALVTASCTGFAAPGVDIQLMQDLKLRPTTPRTHVAFMGCHGVFNALRLARAFAGSEANARVLVCAVELCGLHFHYGFDMQKMVGNALFADGAAAIVGRPDPQADVSHWRLTANASCLVADSESAIVWRIGDHGFDMALSPRVPRLIERHLRPWLERWLRDHNLTVSQIASWAVHPGGPRIVDAVQEGLGLDDSALQASRSVLADYGNMSSPTVVFIVERLRRREAARPCVALGFGPGLTVEAMLFR